MNRYFRTLGWVVALIFLPGMAGCLSLGGKTTHIHEKPETQGRISALETRVWALEQTLHGSAAPVSSTASGTSDSP